MMNFSIEWSAARPVQSVVAAAERTIVVVDIVEDVPHDHAALGSASHRRARLQPLAECDSAFTATITA